MIAAQAIAGGGTGRGLYRAHCSKSQQRWSALQRINSRKVTTIPLPRFTSAPQTPPRGAKRVGTVLKKADQGLDKAFDHVDRAFNRVGERLSRGGSAASEYGQVRLG